MLRRRMMDFKHLSSRRGDDGKSGLIGGERRRKDDLVFECLGAVDELNSWLGMLRASLPGTAYNEKIKLVQGRLIVIGALVASPARKDRGRREEKLREQDLRELEEDERRLLKETKLSMNFTLPGSNETSARADLARSVCRRAERRIAGLIGGAAGGSLDLSLRYLNRLSDYLYVLARALEEDR